MLKKIFFGFIAVAGLASCNSDYKNWESPQANPQHELASMQYTVTLATNSCVVDNFAEGDSIQMLNVSTGDNVEMSSYTLELNGGNDASYNVYASAAGKVAVDDLSAAAIYLFDRQVVARELLCNVWATAKVTTDDGVVDVPVHATDSQTISITPRTSKFNEWIYVAGNHQGWSPATGAALQSPNEDGIYTGFTPLDGSFKFTKIRDWQGDWGFDAFADPGIFTNDGGNLNCTDPGYYYLTVDLVSGKIEATKVVFGLVGPATAGGWDAGQYTVMEYDATENGWVVETELQADEFKFTTNGNWNINLGGSADNLELGGGNLRIAEAGTYLIVLKPGRETSDKMTCTITKQ